MELIQRTIGVWGFGKAGKSAATFFHNRSARVIVFDDNPAMIINVPYLIAPSLESLLDSTDYLFVSPGINTHPYRPLYRGTWLSEVDLFQVHFNKPIIAVTGSVGKTTVVHTLTHLLVQQGVRAIAAGNIGTPMLSIIDQQDTLDMVVLELSSFQLEFAQVFAPFLAIWTNLYPNHLDRHGTMADYFTAKLPILKYQQEHQNALVPVTLRESILASNPKSSIYFFTKECCEANNTHFFCLDMHTRHIHRHQMNKAVPFSEFPSDGFFDNWLVIWAALEILDIPYQTDAKQRNVLEHRLEKVTEVKGMLFYNDSKSTTPTSTLAAVELFKNRRLILFLGGLSKGIDRAPLIKALSGYTIHVICFGKEAAELKTMCDSFAISASAFSNLQEAFHAGIRQTPHYDCMLFSPSGSSYDLFQDYVERGNVFKNLVLQYKDQCS